MTTTYRGAKGPRTWSPGRRRATGLNVALSVVLAAMLTVLVNHLAERHYRRWHVGNSTYFVLSDKTVKMLEGIADRVSVIVLVAEDRPGVRRLRDVQDLLKEYGAAASRLPGLQLDIEYVDPGLDLARTKQLRQKYGLTEANLVIVECRGRHRVVSEEAIFEYDLTPRLYGQQKRKVAFRGEQAISSAILAVTQKTRFSVCFLQGHGERDPRDFTDGGYSKMARLIGEDNLDLTVFEFGEPAAVPSGCDVLVIAGPRVPLGGGEIAALKAYLGRHGSLLLLVDPGVDSGLEDLLAEWGVRVDTAYAVDLAAALRLAEGRLVNIPVGRRELHVSTYAPHEITASLRDVTTVFHWARVIEPAPAASETNARVGRPKVAALALSGPHGWAENDPDQSPPRYDEGADRRGPVAVAVAVEKESVRGIDVEIEPTRLVVAGDSQFVANCSLRGGNGHFFMNALNWLLDRTQLMAIAPRSPHEMRIAATDRQMIWASGLIMAGIPAAVIVLGLLVWLRRRR